LTLSELSRKVGLAHSTVSGIVDRLEARKILERASHESDARFTRIKLSKSLRAYSQRTLPKVELHPMLKALRRAQPAERNSILVGLRTLRRLLETRSSKTKDSELTQNCESHTLPSSFATSTPHPSGTPKCSALRGAKIFHWGLRSDG
jgi:DNA-binding MarR family transcriptional regulator